ncbi:Pde1c [Symbiodinium sp. CCMP2456]|nr:Pde1c [Symbiodinium sp. CCMP2456]
MGGSLASCERCVGPGERLASGAASDACKAESSSMLPNGLPTRLTDAAVAHSDDDVVSLSPQEILTNVFKRLQRAHEEHLVQSHKLLQELEVGLEVPKSEVKACMRKIAAERNSLEEETRAHSDWCGTMLETLNALPDEPAVLQPEEATDDAAAQKEPSLQQDVAIAVSNQYFESTDTAGRLASDPKLRASRALGRRVMRMLAVRWTLYICLTIALFGPGIVTLMNLPDDPTVLILDVIMCLIAFAFAMEMVGLLLSDEMYRFSFFFWMDLLGTLSMAFEISFLLGQYLNSNTVVLRTARTAKLGARIGRLIKLVKCVSMFYRSAAKTSRVEAKVLARRLVVLLSTRVSVIVIVMVMVVPLSAYPLYPTEDMSLTLWPQKLEESYLREQRDGLAGALQEAIDQMVQFYEPVNYSPFLVRGFGDDRTLAANPVRTRNSLKVLLESCRVQRPEGCDVAVIFDFTGPNQMDALVEVGTILFIVLLMAVTSFDLQNVVDRKLVKPLEGMLHHVRENAAHIFDRFAKQTEGTEGAELDDEELQDQQGGASEIELIQAILEKLARLASLAESSNKAYTPAELDAMNAENKAVLIDMLNVQVLQSSAQSKLGGKRNTKADLHATWTQNWNLDFLESTLEEIHGYVHYMFFLSQFGLAAQYTAEDRFLLFVQTVEANYKDVPYHCFQHAVDVCFTVFRLQQITQAGKWTSELEQYALLVAALSHDLGHFGRTNQFLVETKHELALRYNDKSPLENMHCAALFQLCRDPDKDVFVQASKDEQKEVRKVCIATILHTDNVHHFDMVKDISAVYEMESETCDTQAGHPEAFTQAYTENVLSGKNKLMWLQLFLHFADVSNPLKPFHICRAWAWRVLDEFFEQGDEESKLGIPIGMLNDREKVNRPGSQHGFINFLVAPFVAASVRVFPGLHPLHTQMVKNVEEWRNLWIKDAKPGEEDIAKKDADVSRLKALDAELTSRNRAPGAPKMTPRVT